MDPGAESGLVPNQVPELTKRARTCERFLSRIQAHQENDLHFKMY